MRSSSRALHRRRPRGEGQLDRYRQEATQERPKECSVVRVVGVGIGPAEEAVRNGEAERSHLLHAANLFHRVPTGDIPRGHAVDRLAISLERLCGEHLGHEAARPAVRRLVLEHHCLLAEDLLEVRRRPALARKELLVVQEPRCLGTDEADDIVAQDASLEDGPVLPEPVFEKGDRVPEKGHGFAQEGEPRAAGWQWLRGVGWLRHALEYREGREGPMTAYRSGVVASPRRARVTPWAGRESRAELLRHRRVWVHRGRLVALFLGNRPGLAVWRG